MDKIKRIVRSFAQSTTKLNNLSLPAVILIASIILGGFFYATQVNKQSSIERQQQKEYIAKRKLDCLTIYKAESDKFNNVQSWNYDHIIDVYGVIDDACEIIYKNNKTGENFSNYF